jgi:hypothetical protein
MTIRRITLMMMSALVATACSKRAATVGDSSWRTAPIGSVYETRTVTRMEKPFAHETETRMTQTLIARNEVEASIKLEMSEGSTMTSQVVTVPLKQPDAMPAHDGTITTKAEDTCTVGAGTFPCTRATTEAHPGDASRSNTTWTASGYPVPIKSVVRNENMTITTELVAMSLRPDRHAPVR